MRFKFQVANAFASFAYHESKSMHTRTWNAEKKLCKELKYVHALPDHREWRNRERTDKRNHVKNDSKIICFAPSPPPQLALLCKISHRSPLCVCRRGKELKAQRDEKNSIIIIVVVQLNRSCYCWLLLFFQLTSTGVWRMEDPILKNSMNIY